MHITDVTKQQRPKRPENVAHSVHRPEGGAARCAGDEHNCAQWHVEEDHTPTP